MAEQGKGTAVRDGDAGWAGLPPGLDGVDLRTLRAMDGPEVLEAVDLVLAGAAGSRQVWYSGGNEPSSSPSDPRAEPRTFSAVPDDTAPIRALRE
ncbi:hypothetical protein [Streptomyces sp. E5N298]|uniref:hypothetical protein n=1 Tax=Streptomyces sp. E5N298 TaxID=1851983 RepID=UPI000EF5F60B|nr:hypothetical protein [Streptomyces sp. E5N298]